MCVIYWSIDLAKTGLCDGRWPDDAVWWPCATFGHSALAVVAMRSSSTAWRCKSLAPQRIADHVASCVSLLSKKSYTFADSLPVVFCFCFCSPFCRHLRRARKRNTRSARSFRCATFLTWKDAAGWCGSNVCTSAPSALRHPSRQTRLSSTSPWILCSTSGAALMTAATRASWGQVRGKHRFTPPNPPITLVRAGYSVKLLARDEGCDGGYVKVGGSACASISSREGITQKSMCRVL